MTTRRVVIDSSSVHPLVEIPGAYEAVRQAVDSGQLGGSGVTNGETRRSLAPDHDRHLI